MAQVTSQFSKKIQVFGEEEELELLFECLKKLRARDKALHTRLLATVNQIIISDETIAPDTFEAPPFGIWFSPNLSVPSGRTVSLFLHPQLIRYSSSWTSAAVAFRVQLLEEILSEMLPDSCPSDSSVLTLVSAGDRIQRAWVAARAHLEAINAPRQELVRASELEQSFHQPTVLPVLYNGREVPLGDILNPIQNANDDGLLSLMRLVTRSSERERLLASQLALSSAFEGYLVLASGVYCGEGPLTPLDTGLLVEIESFHEEPSGLSVTFKQQARRVQILGYGRYKEIDLVKIGKVEEEVAVTESEQHLLLEIQDDLEQIELDSARLSNISPQKHPKPQNPLALISRALRLTETSFDIRRKFLDRGLSQEFLTLLKKRSAYYRKRSAFMPRSQISKQEGRSAFSTNFNRWFEGICLFAHHQQRRFQALVEPSSWDFDGDRNLLYLPEAERQFRAYPLFSSAHAQSDLLWSWGNSMADFSEEARHIVRKLVAVGEEYQIPELSQPHLPLLNFALEPSIVEMLHTMAMLATALLGGDAYYPASVGEASIFFILHDDEGSLAEKSHLGSVSNEVALYLPEAIINFQLEKHAPTIESYLRCLAGTVEYDTKMRTYTATLQDGSAVAVSLNEHGSLQQILTSLTTTPLSPG